MKKITLILISLIFTLGAFAQKGNLGTKNPQECKKNLSLYTDYLGQKRYADAMKFWNKVIEYCPEYSSNLYDNGAYIIRQLLKDKTLSAERKMALKDSALWAYTENIRIFGDNPKVSSAYGYYLVLYKNDFEKGAAILKKAIDSSGNNVSSRTISKYAFALKKLIVSKKTDCDELVNEYDRLSEIIENNISKKGYDKAQKSIDKYLGPCLTCDKLLPIWKEKKFEKAKTDDLLRKSMLSTLKKRNCTDNDIFIDLAKIEADLNPSATAFRNLGVIFYNKKSYSEAFTYFDKAIDLAENNTEKEKATEEAMDVSIAAKKSSKVKEYVSNLLKLNPKNEKAILYKARQIAISGCPTSPFEQKALNWAAYDMAIKVSSSAANKYKARFPTKDDLFKNGIKEGTTYKTCNGISTKVRAK